MIKIGFMKLGDTVKIRALNKDYYCFISGDIALHVINKRCIVRIVLIEKYQGSKSGGLGNLYFLKLKVNHF